MRESRPLRLIISVKANGLTEDGEEDGGPERRVDDGLVLGLAGPRHAVVGGRRPEPDGRGGGDAPGGVVQLVVVRPGI